MAVLNYQMIEVHSSILVNLSLDNLIHQKIIQIIAEYDWKIMCCVNHWNEYVKLVT